MNANASLGVAGLRKRRWKGYLLGLALTGVVLRGAEELTPTAQALLLAREAAEATAAEDNAAALAKLEAAFELRPDLPRIVLALASAQARAEQPEDAVATLKRAAALGIGARVEQQAEFAALRGRPDFKEVVRQFAANQNPKGEGEVAFSLSGVTGLIEGIAWREKTGMFYFADVNGRAVWLRQAKTGALRRLTPEGDELLGVYALAIDEAAGALWAATAGVAAMRDSNAEQNGSAALVEIDLESGAIRRSFALARGAGDEGTQHLLTHVALAPDGAVYATDRASPLVWRLAAGDNTLNVCAESPEFMALNAVAVVAEGGALVLADGANGLLRLDPVAKTVVRLDPPPGTTLVGIRSLTVAPDGSLLAVQNGVRPPRVLRVRLDDTAEIVRSVTVLEAAHLSMAAPALGCMAEGDFYFIGNAGWARFELGDGAPSSPRSVPVFRVKISGSSRKK